MKQKFEKGFTLVEVMVVIVILGILAAVAVPKLFGSVAKAKASEIAPAAGTYQKLQDLYLAEKGEIGAWDKIGYIAPGNGKTNNFTYCGGEITEDIKVDDFGEVSKVGWQVTNNVSLNECTAGHWWFVAMKPESSHYIFYTTETNAQECVALAKPNWTVASRTGMSCGAAGSVAESGKNTDPSVGVNLMANGAVTAKNGGWNGDGVVNGSMVNEIGKGSATDSASSVYNSVMYTYNTAEGSNGLFLLEPKSTYTFTITDPDAYQGNSAYLQTDVRVYTNTTTKEKATIMCGSTNQTVVSTEGATAWDRTGTNVSTNAKAGYDAVAVYDKATGTTTITITTGSEPSYFGANIRKSGAATGLGNADETERASVQNSISNATLVKTGSSDGSKTAKQVAQENAAAAASSSSSK